MQHIWKRAIQPQCSCHCASGLYPSAGLARSTTTASASRHLRFGDIFTVFYSSIFATAAVADAKRKDIRRRKLDSDLARAKEDLKELEIKQKCSELANARGTDGSEITEALSTTQFPTLHETDSDPLERKLKQTDRDVTSEREWHYLFGRAAEERKVRDAIGAGAYKGVSLSLLESLSSSELERLSMAMFLPRTSPDIWAAQAHSHPLSAKKLRTLELSILKLVFRFLSEVASDGTKDHPDDLKPKVVPLPLPHSRQALLTKALEMHDHICELRKIHGQSWTLFQGASHAHPTYVDAPLDGIAKGGKLNGILLGVLRNPRRDKTNIDALLVQICYNLLASETAPDIHTYNILIINLGKLKQRNLVQAVIESMLECYIIPNEITITSVLNFYIHTGDRSGFMSYWRRMRGGRIAFGLAHPRTLVTRYESTETAFRSWPIGRIKRPEAYDLVSIKEGITGPRLIVHDRNHPRKTQDEGHLQLRREAPMNQQTYGALIHGLLKFSDLKLAWAVCLQMVDEGWELNELILTSILKRCAEDSNWGEGYLVWTQLKATASQVNERGYYWMLSLCWSYGKLDEFAKIVSSASSEILTFILAQCVLQGQCWGLGRMLWQQVQESGRSVDLLAYETTLYLCNDRQRDELEVCIEQAAKHGILLPIRGCIKSKINVSWLRDLILFVRKLKIRRFENMGGNCARDSEEYLVSLPDLERHLSSLGRWIGDSAYKLAHIELTVYLRPTVGHWICHKLQQLNKRQPHIPTTPSELSREQTPDLTEGFKEAYHPISEPPLPSMTDFPLRESLEKAYPAKTSQDATDLFMVLADSPRDLTIRTV